MYKIGASAVPRTTLPCIHKHIFYRTDHVEKKQHYMSKSALQLGTYMEDGVSPIIVRTIVNPFWPYIYPNFGLASSSSSAVLAISLI